jgi:hypothetical protein
MPEASARLGDAAAGQNRRVPEGCGKFSRLVRQAGSSMRPASMSPSFLPFGRISAQRDLHATFETGSQAKSGAKLAR